MMLITIFVNLRLRDSKMGRAWIAVREDEVAASAMGVPLMRTKLWAYAIGAIFGGFAGAVYGSFINGIFPTSFSFQISVIVLVMVIVGGMGNIWGVIAGAMLDLLAQLPRPRQDRRVDQRRDPGVAATTSRSRSTSSGSSARCS